MKLTSRHALYTVAFASSVVVASCTGETDPAKAGLFDNINNLSTGEYDRQIAASEAKAAQIARDNQRRTTSINQLSTQKKANAGTASRLRREISAARAELASAKANVGGDPAKLARLNQLDGQLASVQKASAGGAPDSVLRSELASIRSSIRAISS